MFRAKKTFGGPVVMGDESIMVRTITARFPCGRPQQEPPCAALVISHIIIHCCSSSYSPKLQSPKAHGTSNVPVQKNLRWGCERDVADRICNFNRCVRPSIDDDFLLEGRANHLTSSFSLCTVCPFFYNGIDTTPSTGTSGRKKTWRRRLTFTS